jgi:hypothetical protein
VPMLTRVCSNWKKSFTSLRAWIGTTKPLKEAECEKTAQLSGGRAPCVFRTK